MLDRFAYMARGKGLVCAAGVVAGLAVSLLVAFGSVTDRSEVAEGLPRLVHKHSRSTYGVYGDDVDKMRRSLGFWGPGGHWGYATWRYEWTGDLEEGIDGRCRGRDLAVHLRTSTRTPVIARLSFPKACPKERFHAMRRALELHEQIHVEIAVQTAEEARRAMAAIEGAATCADLRKAYDSALARAADAGNVKQSRFDVDTRNGQEQGVELSDCE